MSDRRWPKLESYDSDNASAVTILTTATAVTGIDPPDTGTKRLGVKRFDRSYKQGIRSPPYWHSLTLIPLNGP